MWVSVGSAYSSLALMASSLFHRSQSSRSGRSKARLRAHTAANSDNQYVHIQRSASQRPSRNKLKSGKRPRAASLGKKGKSKGYKVNAQNINLQYLSNQNKKISVAIKDVEKTINDLDKTEEILKTEINKKFENIINSINQQKLKLENELKSTVDKKKQILNQQSKELQQYNDNFKSITTSFSENKDKEDVVKFLNEPKNQKYNVQHIECSVSSAILIKNLEIKNKINKQISDWGKIEVGEVPKSAPIIKAVMGTNAANKIEIKCFEPKNVNDELEITKFEIEYIQIPPHWKSRWKRVKKQIFELINNEININNDNTKKNNNDDDDDDDSKQELNDNSDSMKSQRITIDKDKNFKNNIITLNLKFGCDYLIRARCYNLCGPGPFSKVPKLISIYDINNEGHWKFGWEYFTDNMRLSGKDKKTITKINGKQEWNSLGRGPTFPSNFVDGQMKIFWNVKINYCYEADIGSLHFGVMSKKCKPEDVWSECIGFAEYESLGMSKFNKTPTFQKGSIVKIVIDFKTMEVEFYENDQLLGSQNLNVLKAKPSDLCFGVGCYRKKNAITLL